MSALPASSPRAAAERPERWFRFLLCCFAAICGFRFFLIQKFAGPAAFFSDDFEAIAHRILAAYENGTLAFSALFTPHNGDHVIFVTREWDVQLSMMVKVPVFAAAMTIVIHLLTRGLPRWRHAAAAILTGLFAFPFNYHNLLWAFQSQFDFFFLCAALGWLALLNGQAALALLSAVAALFTLGAGPIVAASYVPFFLASAFITKTQPRRNALLFAGAAVAIAALGLTFPDATAAPRTGTLAEKAATLMRLYAWPFSNLLSAVERLPEVSGVIPRPVLNFPSAESSWMLTFADALHRHPALVVLVNSGAAVVLLAPIASVAWLAVRKRISLSAAAGPLNVAVFAGLMIAATAIARTDTTTIALRFIDHVSLAAFASIMGAFILARHVRRARPWLAMWGLVVGFGYLATAGATLSQIVHRRNPETKREIVQRYYAGSDRAKGVLVTHHEAMLENQAYNNFVMGGSVDGFLALLDDPIVLPVLPHSFTVPNSPPGRAAVVANAIGRFGLVLVVVAVGYGAFLTLQARRKTLYRPTDSFEPTAPAAGV
jgi:hypothetical protein